MTAVSRVLPVVDAATVRVGDDIRYLGRPHRVTSIEDAVHPDLGRYRIARSFDGWGYALFDGDPVEVNPAPTAAQGEALANGARRPVLRPAPADSEPERGQAPERPAEGR